MPCSRRSMDQIQVSKVECVDWRRLEGLERGRKGERGERNEVSLGQETGCMDLNRSLAP